MDDLRACGKDLFVHYSDIKTDGYASLKDGQKVQFEIGQVEKGPRATNVHRGGLLWREKSSNGLTSILKMSKKTLSNGLIKALLWNVT